MTIIEIKQKTKKEELLLIKDILQNAELLGGNSIMVRNMNFAEELNSKLSKYNIFATRFTVNKMIFTYDDKDVKIEAIDNSVLFYKEIKTFEIVDHGKESQKDISSNEYIKLNQKDLFDTITLLAKYSHGQISKNETIRQFKEFKLPYDFKSHITEVYKF